MTFEKKSLLHYWLNLLHYREVLYYWLIFITLSGSITLLEQNIIIDIFHGIPLIFMAAIFKIVIRIPLGILSGFLQDRLT